MKKVNVKETLNLNVILQSLQPNNTEQSDLMWMLCASRQLN